MHFFGNRARDSTPWHIYSRLVGASQPSRHLNHGRNCSEIENFYHTLVCLFGHSLDGLFVCCSAVPLAGTFNSEWDRATERPLADFDLFAGPPMSKWN